MADKPERPLDLPEIVRRVRARTPARLLAGRAGAAYRTGTQLDLREAHAAARDAVAGEFEWPNLFEPAFVAEWRLFQVHTRATSKEKYLLRPDLGRRFDDPSRAEIARRCIARCDFQVAIGDGLSVPAVRAQVPALFPMLCEGAKARGWTVGQAFVIHHCRVGVLNEIGDLLCPRVAVLLIGERPGLASTESTSAYMAYRPRAGHSDADRNLISNIHARGVKTEDAAERILNLAARMMEAQLSGHRLREEIPPHANPLRLC